MSFRITISTALLCCLAMVASACGDDDPTQVESGAPAQAQVNEREAEVPENEGGIGDEPIPVEPDGGIGDEPIPVEPDGGIGDGAGPIPGFEEEPEDTGTWHGAVVAETNCPGMTWERVEASAFSFSVPSDFVAEDAQGVDSEVGLWTGPNGIELSYDYGWYSGSIADSPGAEVESVDYSGRLGEFAVVRAEAGSAERNMVGVLFPEVAQDGTEWNRLGMMVTHDDPNDEIIGRCIVRSIDWS